MKGGKQKISPDSSSKTQSDRIEEMLDIVKESKIPPSETSLRTPETSGASINPHAWGAMHTDVLQSFFLAYVHGTIRLFNLTLATTIPSIRWT